MSIKTKTILEEKLNNLINLDDLFPDRLYWMSILKEFCFCSTYWKIPKTWTLDENNINRIIKILKVLEKYSEIRWDIKCQEKLSDNLIKKKLINPYKKKAVQKKSDFTALARIIKLELQYLGFCWIDEKGIFITKAGDLLIGATTKDERLNVLEKQILKFQFEYIKINPVVFITQLLSKIEHKITREEWVIFVNMTNKMQDVDKCAERINKWRSLNEIKRNKLINVIKKIPRIEQGQGVADMFGYINVHECPRYLTIEREYSYQKGFILFPLRNYFDERENGN